MAIKKTQVFHDRFIILDGNTAYHVGASIKDAGKKCFGITLLADHLMSQDPTLSQDEAKARAKEILR